jgi:hypothetical protein
MGFLAEPVTVMVSLARLTCLMALEASRAAITRASAMANIPQKEEEGLSVMVILAYLIMQF